MLKKFQDDKFEEFKVWDWRPIAADTFLKVLRIHSNEGGEPPQVETREITTGEWAHWYRYIERKNDLVIIFCSDGRTTAFRRRDGASN